MSAPVPSVALAHHWLVKMRGGERTLEQILALFPKPSLFTLLHRAAGLSGRLREMPVQASWLSHLPGVERYYPALLGLMPAAARTLRPAAVTRLVLSSDASVVKCLTVPAGAMHVCYCYSPPRYLWDLEDEYAAPLSALERAVFRWVVPGVREADREAAQKVSHFIAISEFIRERIARCYGREAVVIPPPVDVAAFRADVPAGGEYVAISELVSYKRLDLAVDCFNRLGLPLVIIGGGRQLAALRAKAKPNVRLVGPQPFPVLKETLERARALVFPGLEDFGIVMVEALACGKPVIAFAQGGARDIVTHERTGFLFAEQSVECLAESVLRCERERERFEPAICRAAAEPFAEPHFRARLAAHLNELCPGLPLVPQ